MKVLGITKDGFDVTLKLELENLTEKRWFNPYITTIEVEGIITFDDIDTVKDVDKLEEIDDYKQFLKFVKFDGYDMDNFNVVIGYVKDIKDKRKMTNKVWLELDLSEYDNVKIDSFYLKLLDALMIF